MGFFVVAGTTVSTCMGSFLTRALEGEEDGDEVDKKRSSLLCVGSTGEDPILRFFNPAIHSA